MFKPSPRMILISTALMAEARPLISYYGLKNVDKLPHLRLWRSEDIMLVVTGTGKVRAASAVASACTAFTSETEAAINIGLAGAAFAAEKGQLFLVHKISDHHSGTSYYPDMLLKTDLKEAALTTWDHPVTGQHLTDKKDVELVDMEASGFCEAALTFLPESRVGCLKIVSDFLEGDFLGKREVKHLIENRMESLAGYLNHLKQFLRENRPESLTPEENRLLKDVAVNMNLTRTQKRQLEKAVLYKKLTSGSIMENLEPLVQLTIQTKQQRDKHFNSLLARLHQTDK